ncbi:MAG TPA: hypothetical protein ENO22_01030 [candidate division Zixibacteria bacterium]|nr:hypothetical protein [candidate division Zixibacteria bacterium]
MKKLFAFTISLAISFCFLILASPAEAGTRFGGGIHYLRTLGDIKDAPEFDENAVGFMGSVLFTHTMFRLEGAIEVIPDFGASEKTMFEPQAYAMIGQFIYGGVGIGIGYLDDSWQSNPFYALRAGVDFFVGGLDLDVFASYRFQKANDLEHLGSDDLDSITFGVLIRFGTR